MANVYEELRSNAKKLAEFNAKVAAYIDTGTGVPPNLEELVSSLSIDEIVKISQALSNGSMGSSTGALLQSLQDTLAIMRESNLVYMSKAQIYGQGTGELLQNSEKIISDVAKTINIVQGRSPSQGITL